MAERRLDAVVFLSGFVVMALELSGSRVLAPFLGSSTFVWTSLIGIILASLSCGYWWGGKLADRRPEYKLLAKILCAASLYIAVVAFANVWLLSAMYRETIDLRTGSVIAALVLFAVPSVLLGMVTPFAVRLKITDIHETGRVAGRLYAISTVGSILGTFAAGFYLISYLGTQRILLLLALFLLIASIISHSRGGAVLRGVTMLVIGAMLFVAGQVQLALGSSGYVDLDTAYHRIIIADSKDKTTGRPIRALITDPHTAQGVMFLDKPDESYSLYVQFYDRFAAAFYPNVERALLVGGGAYLHPRFFIKQNPTAVVDVVEIDPKMIELARAYFQFEDDLRLKVFHEDGRTFINRSTENYQLIFVDAFQSSAYIPFQLATQEAVARYHAILKNKNGAVVFNVFSGIDGPRGQFLRAFHRTLKQLFKHVYVFPTGRAEDPDLSGNLVVVASDRNLLAAADGNPEAEEIMKARWQGEIAEDVVVLTDEFAPVERYVAPAVTDLARSKRQ